jgi:hypothetical protein
MNTSEYRISKNLKKHLKDSHDSIPVEKRLTLEMLEILSSFYFLQRNGLAGNSDDALDNMARIKFIQLLTNDIILRLCKFRDESSMSLSFIQVLKALRKRATTKSRVENIEADIKKYNSLTSNLESHRNAYIAHLSKRDRTHLRPPVELFDCIALAIEVTDKLCGCKNSYELLDIDLRRALFGETTA